MKIKKYNPDNQKKESVFYIQSHGLHAGRPLKKPIPNSWEIEININNAFEICYMIYNSKILYNYLRGSVIPFLSLTEYKKIINPIFKNPIQNEESTIKKLKTLASIDQLIRHQEEQKKHYQLLKTTIANELLKQFNIKSH
jgi:hypothetical protein